jgi:hypothetical protein
MTTLPNDSALGETGATGRPNPFDLEALRAASDLDDFDIGKILTTVPVRRPGRNQFFRIRPDDEFAVDGYVLEHESEMDRTIYWVAPELRVPLRDHLVKVRLYTAIDKRGNVFLWPAKLPTADSNAAARSWHLSGLRAAEEAKQLWVKIIGNKAISAYDIVKARGDLGDPQWPDQSFQELIEIAFRDRVIDNLEHPVIQEIDGVI